MILVILLVIFMVKPPIASGLKNSILPEASIVSLFPAILTLLGGTVGGYITFAGAHRLIDAGVTGEDKLRDINYSAVMGMFCCHIWFVSFYSLPYWVLWQRVSAWMRKTRQQMPFFRELAYRTENFRLGALLCGYYLYRWCGIHLCQLLKDIVSCSG